MSYESRVDRRWATRRAGNPRYEPYHPKWYRKRVPIFWWLENLAYVKFITRELTSLAVGYAVNYSIEDNLFLSNRGTLDIISGCKCWAFQFEARDHRTRGLEFSFRIAILGFGARKPDPFAGNVGFGTGSKFP